MTEIIVVNNSSQQNLNLPTKEHIRVLRYPQRLRYSESINKAAKTTQDDFLLFCDTDTYFPDPGWLAKHLEVHASNPHAGITGSKLLDSKTGRIIDFGIGRTKFNHFHPHRGWPPSHHLVDQNRQVQMACSAVMLINTTLFQELGGLDEALLYHYQDVDLCLRAKKLRRTTWVVADAWAFHCGSSAEVKKTPYKIDERAYYTAKNSHEMQVDFPHYLKMSLTNLLGNTERKPIGLVNLSTMTDPSEAITIIEQYFTLTDLVDLPQPERDLKHLTLLDLVEIQTIRKTNPLIFLVDCFTSLRYNSLFADVRDIGEDIVVDRHCNAAMLQAIIWKEQT